MTPGRLDTIQRPTGTVAEDFQISSFLVPGYHGGSPLNAGSAPQSHPNSILTPFLQLIFQLTLSLPQHSPPRSLSDLPRPRPPGRFHRGPSHLSDNTSFIPKCSFNPIVNQEWWCQAQGTINSKQTWPLPCWEGRLTKVSRNFITRKHEDTFHPKPRIIASPSNSSGRPSPGSPRPPSPSGPHVQGLTVP